jgi:hypothetical protein
VRISRRQALVVAASVPAGFLVGVIANVVGTIVARAAPGLRPAAVGTSASRCAACGAGDHAMLDPSCPAARKVR